MRCFVAALFVIVLASAHAQEFRGTLEGSITTGANIPVSHARIEAVQQDTGARTDTVTDAQGRYTLPGLAPGSYQVTVKDEGFKTYVRQGITLDPGSHVAINPVLTPGAITETITIRQDASMAGGRSAASDQTMGTQAVRELPLNGGAPSTLSQLAPGMAKTDAPGETRPFDNSSNGTVAGTPTGSTEVELDGSSDIDWKFRTTFNPPADVVGQVKTTVFQPDAAYGHSGGGFVNMTTKGGGNKFHGDAYEFNKVSYFAANSYFNNLSGLKRPVTNYNQYGLTANGPIFIPYFFDGRKKLLWEFAWQGIRDTTPASGTTSVPTDKEKTGDFSDVTGVIYDPYSTTSAGKRTAIPGNCLFGTCANGYTGYYGSSMAAFNPIAANLMKYYPSGVTTAKVNNYAIDPVSPDFFDSEFGRLDFIPSASDKLFYKMWHNQRLQKGNNFLGNEGTGLNLTRENWGMTLDEVHTLNPNTSVNVRFNWMRFVETQAPTSAGMTANSLGFENLASTYNAMPLIKFTGTNSSASCTTSSGNAVTSGSGLQCLGSGSNSSAGQNAFDSYHIFGDVTHKAGAHNLKAGIDVRQNRRFTTNWQNATGTYTFGNDYTLATPTTSAGSSNWGADIAEFELGLPSSGEYDTDSFSATKLEYMALFVQDDYKVRSNLVINAGIRFEHDFPMTERSNRSTNGFDPNAPHSFTNNAIASYSSDLSANQATVTTNATTYGTTFAMPTAIDPLGGLTFTSANNRNIYQTPSKIFSPRIGVSWKPERLKGTTIQAGFGLYVFPIAPIADPTQNGFSSASTYVPSTDGSFYLPPSCTSYTSCSKPSGAYWQNAFPSGLTSPTGASAGADTFVGKTIAFLAPQQRDGYSERWQFQIQKQLTPNDLVQLSYLGNRAIRIQVTDNYPNAIPQKYRQTTAQQEVLNASTKLTNPFHGILPSTTTLGTTSIGLSQLLVAYPEFPSGSGIDEEDLNAGESHFHSFNARYDHRMSKGFSITSNFSWSKLIEGLSYKDNADKKFERRISTIDYPFHLSATGVYNLPFGKGKLYNPSNLIARKAVEEWTLTVGYSMQSGAPVKWSTIAQYYGGDLHWNARNHTKAFDTTQFNTSTSTTAYKAFASYSVRNFPTTNTHWRADSLNEWNASLLKNIALYRNVKFQFRAEAFNVLNHVTYSAPAVTPTSSSFGTITSQYNTPRTLQFGGKINW
ncbi:carboxypeptidase regulatory-like domain-containing protein [Telmatobacter bradus]|uniref:carboxypeptidase regulatory-like domain-containing protein n=1 Tax=Telmatobacter bradus TaxID=474953 RepID=UPI003B4315F8